MNYSVVILPEAEQDAHHIYRWIAERSVDGADRWYDRFLASLHRIAADAKICGLAPENEHVEQEIRQLLFKTPKGLRYRVLLTIVETTVYVLHVRGPGQRLVAPDDMRRFEA